MVEVSFDALRKIQLQERNYAALVPLEEDFFDAYRNHVEQQRKSLHESFSLDAASAYEGTRKLLSEVVSRRQQKIFLKALRDFHAGTVSGSGLAKEEKDLYNSLIKLLGGYESKLFESFAAEKTVVEKPADCFMKVQLLSEVPQFVGVSGLIGPFGANQVASLPKEDAKLLVSQGVAQEA